MKKLIIASNNQNKIKEIKEILSGLDVNVVSLKEENIDIDVVEDGNTFEENAKKKSKEIYEFLKNRNEKDFMVLADDSGICVDFLNGAPGVYSARYSGVHGNDDENNKKLLKELEGQPFENRKAQFVCDLALFNDDGKYYNIRGEVEGYVIEELVGNDGFGYDPLFFYKELNKTFAEITLEEKNKISHRAKALRKLKDVIIKLI